MEGDEVMTNRYSDAAFGMLIKDLFGSTNENGAAEHGKGDEAFAQCIMGYASVPDKGRCLDVELIKEVQTGSEDKDMNNDEAEKREGQENNERTEEPKPARKSTDEGTDKHSRDPRWETTQMKAHHKESLARHKESRERNAGGRDTTPQAGEPPPHSRRLARHSLLNARTTPCPCRGPGWPGAPT